MSTTFGEIETQVLALPAGERLLLAQRLWDSLEQPGAPVPDMTETEVIALARRRDSELEAGRVEGRPHEEVMKAAREGLQCK